MKIAVIGDPHMGKRQYRTDENNFNKYEHAGYKAFDEYVDKIIEEKPDLVVIPGDIYDKPNPPVLAMTKYFMGINRLIEAGIEVMAIEGNHDFSFINRNNKCSAAEMAPHTYYADYEIKTVVIDDILFVMMPYLYDTDANIEAYLQKCKDIAVNSDCPRKVLVTHGVTEKYYKDSFIPDKMMFPDDTVEEFNFVIIGHIHTPFAYKQKDTVVLSPGAMIDYQAYTDRTGITIIDTDTWHFNKIKIKTPHIIKRNCDESNINKILENVTEDIYHLSFKGDTSVIDNDLFIEANKKSIQLAIEVVTEETVEETTEKKPTSLIDIYSWVATHYKDYSEYFEAVKEARTGER